jgi:hypothetical protein
MENRKVRVALDKEGNMIAAGNPDNKEFDKDYADYLRMGYEVKIIYYSEYLKLIPSKLRF